MNVHKVMMVVRTIFRLHEVHAPVYKLDIHPWDEEQYTGCRVPNITGRVQQAHQTHQSSRQDDQIEPRVKGHLVRDAQDQSKRSPHVMNDCEYIMHYRRNCSELKLNYTRILKL